MQLKTLDDIHNASMLDPEYREAWEAEERRERLQLQLTEWRKQAGLTSAQVAERMGIKPQTISRMEKHADRVTFDTLSRYARACGISRAVINF